jgi:Ca2+-binding RTX toxin-like protein
MAAINGTDGNDTLTGSDANDSISGLAGNDTLRGGDGADSLYGGDGQDDWLFGDSGNDYLQDSYGLMSGGAGNDTLDGTADGLNDSFVDADYGQEAGTAGITVNLLTGRATDTYGDTDTLINIKGIIASSRADHLTGGIGDELFRGMAGNDTIDGGAGWDEVHYRLDAGAGGTAGVTVNLLTGLAVDGFGNTDQLISIERVRGSGFADLITGNADDNRFRGLGGNDTMAGGDGWDSLDYSVDARYGGAFGVTVNLATGRATDGTGDTDSFTSIEAVKGTNFGDTLVGDEVANLLQGQGGNDTLNGGGGNDTLQGGSGDDWNDGSAGSDTVDGGSGYDRANYRNLGVAVTIDMTAGTVVKAGGGSDTLISIERVMGSELADSIVGSAADDDFSGNQGNDTLDGGAGGDNVWYGNATSAVVVDLQAGTATGGEGSDKLISIEYVEGSGFADTLLGSSADNYFRGDGATTDTRGGADYIDGRAGFDVIDYRDDPQRVTVSLASGLATDGRGYTDTLISIEEARGSEYNDVLTGSTNLYFERFEGRGGNDTIDGGAITDTLNQDNANQASYLNAIGSVTVNLAIGSATGAAGNDVLLNFNQVRGSGFDDVLIGSNRTDVTEHFEGGLGNDTLTARAALTCCVLTVQRQPWWPA